MRYDKKIKYLDYLENGARVKGGGFLKTELFEDSFKLELTVKGGRGIGDAAGDVFLCGNGREEPIGKIQLSGGQGEFRHACHISAEKGGIIGETGIACHELRGVRIPLGEGREITCIWAEAGQGKGISASGELPEEQRERESSPGAPLQAAQAVQPAGAPQPAKVLRPARALQSARASRSVRGPGPAGVPQSIQVPQSADVPRSADVPGPAGVSQSSQAHQPSERQEEASTREIPGREIGRENGQEAVPLLENKWLQLCAIYPHVKPFQDQREYLSIGPEDFVLFSAESYKAACNSFMLHGYYNYRHLILAREERRGEIVYYAGVPGNYYDREKQVAIMFGFESFECAEEPAQSSDFGYYMMRVQL